MPIPPKMGQVPPFYEAVLAEVNAQVGGRYQWQRQLLGGEQGSAHLVVRDGRRTVLKWEPAGRQAAQLLRAFPAVNKAIDGGWPAARWLAVGPLIGGGAFVLQEYVQGTPMIKLDVDSVRVAVQANATQSGLASADAFDDSSQLEAVLRGDHAWKEDVSSFTAAGAALVEHGDEVTAWAGRVAIPVSDVIHGDYSSSNILLDSEHSTATFVDCQTIGRGSRVRDLADLYRQSFVYPSPDNTASGLLRTAAIAADGPQVFAKCAVAVTYNNLAWWVEHKPPTESDQACTRLHQLFNDLRHQPS